MAGREGSCDVAVEGGRVVAVDARLPVGPGDRAADLQGRFLLSALVNAHDALDASTLPPLGRPPYANLYEWIAAAGVEAGGAEASMRMELADRLWLGGLRNLLSGAGRVVHHEADHRSLGRPDFPVRVQRRYGFAHSPGLVPGLRRTYRTTDRRIPWFVRAAAGTDAAAAAEVARLQEANVLRQNTVVVHGTGLSPKDVACLAQARAALVWCPEVDARLLAAQPPIVELLRAGVGLALGSGSPAEGGRDLLSALAAARATGFCDDVVLLDLATEAGAGVARLPGAGPVVGATADLLAVPTPGRLLEGDRTSVDLVMVGGRPRYGDPALLAALLPATGELKVDGAPRALDAALLRRLRGLWPRGPAPPRWLEGVML